MTKFEACAIARRGSLPILKAEPSKGDHPLLAPLCAEQQVALFEGFAFKIA